MNEENQNQTNELEIYECLTIFREPLIERIIDSLDIKPDSTGLDIGCGIGMITNLLANRTGLNGEIVGLDISEEFINYAQSNSKQGNINYLQRDVNYLNFKDNSFDWIWSMDTIWAGPKEFGCPAEEPDLILNKLYQLLKPGGRVSLVFWSSQKLFPGYPILEAKLNASISANRPYLNDMQPKSHILNGRRWLSDANFKNIKTKSFIGDISAPINENDKKALTTLFQMFWGESQRDVSKEDWEKYIAICSANSNEFILNDPYYYGFYTYTLFQGGKN